MQTDFTVSVAIDCHAWLEKNSEQCLGSLEEDAGINF